MSYTEAKKFTFNRPPRGEDIAALIKEHELLEWRLTEIDTDYTPTDMLVYTVIFERMIR